MSTGNRWLSSFALVIYAFLFAPIVVLILFSFNNSRRTFVWHGFTLDWYPKLLANSDLLDSLQTSLIVAAVAVVVATVLGSLLGLGLARLRFRGSGAAETIATVPTPSMGFELPLRSNCAFVCDGTCLVNIVVSLVS